MALEQKLEEKISGDQLNELEKLRKKVSQLENEPTMLTLALMDKLKEERPLERSEESRKYAIAITETEKLTAYLKTLGDA